MSMQRMHGPFQEIHENVESRSPETCPTGRDETTKFELCFGIYRFLLLGSYIFYAGIGKNHPDTRGKKVACSNQV